MNNTKKTLICIKKLVVCLPDQSHCRSCLHRWTVTGEFLVRPMAPSLVADWCDPEINIMLIIEAFASWEKSLLYNNLVQSKSTFKWVVVASIVVLHING